MQRPVQVIYVHGFGGLKQDQFGRPFAAFFNSYSRQLKESFNLRQLVWRSEWGSLAQMPAAFQRARAEANGAAAELSSLIQDLEDQQAPYHLVGFSLGAEVIRLALQLHKERLPCLRSVYFLGAAFNHDEPVNETAIPPTARCHNYHSQKCDYVLRFSYRAASRGVPAAGERGLANSALFLNLPTRCSHKLIHNYSMLARPIGFMISWDEGALIDGKATIRPRRYLGGQRSWNHIARHKGYVVQQQVRFRGHYRAIRELPSPRVGVWSTNLHAVLKLLS
jgi:pimeloyl-ACP methyl ester carboxylesterase